MGVDKEVEVVGAGKDAFNPNWHRIGYFQASHMTDASWGAALQMDVCRWPVVIFHTLACAPCTHAMKCKKY